MKQKLQYFCILLALFAGVHHITAQDRNLFEGDYGGNKIYQFAPDGSRSTFAIALTHPLGLAFDKSGNLFLAVQNSGAAGSGIIYEFTNNAAVLSSNAVIFASGLTTPEALAFDNAGNLFEADAGSGNVYEFTNYLGTLSSNVVTFASGMSSGAGPTGLAFDNATNLFVSDYAVGVIYKITPDGTRSTFKSGLNNPSGLAFDGAGNLFASDVGSDDIYEFTNNAGTLSSNSVVFASGLNSPVGLAFNNAGNLFVADQGSSRIYEFTPNGSQSTFASGLLNPTFIAFGSFVPALSIASTGNQSVLFWSASGTNYVLQSTTNLASPNWVTASDAVPVIAFTVTNNLPVRFFRIQSQ